jgi:hypothetical protein
VREKEPGGNCEHCGRFRNVLFSYDDDHGAFHSKGCWIAAKLIDIGVRPPSRAQVTEQNQRRPQTIVRRKAMPSNVVRIADRRAC